MRKVDETNQDVEWAWIDFIEGDVEPSLESDLKMLLKISPQSRDVVEKLQCTKDVVKSLDPAHDDFLGKWDAKANLMKIMEVCQNSPMTWQPTDADWEQPEWPEESAWQPSKQKTTL